MVNSIATTSDVSELNRRDPPKTFSGSDVVAQEAVVARRQSSGAQRPKLADTKPNSNGQTVRQNSGNEDSLDKEEVIFELCDERIAPSFVELVSMRHVECEKSLITRKMVTRMVSFGLHDTQTLIH